LHLLCLPRAQNTACYLFSINITLTEAGLAAGEGLGLAAIELAFQYIQMLRKTGADTSY
jgi:hypothetical protein